MSSKPKTGVFQAAFAQPMSEETRAQELFNKQKAYFASDATKSYEWRIDLYCSSCLREWLLSRFRRWTRSATSAMRRN